VSVDEPKLEPEDLHRQILANLSIYSDRSAFECFALPMGKAQLLEFGLKNIAFVQGMSPVAWQHVNMYGSFEFSDDDHDIDLGALAAQYADSVVWSNATQPGQGDLFD